MKIWLDDVDITDDLMAQYKIPNISGGIYPNKGTKWYNLLPIIENHSELKKMFSSGGLHTIKITGEEAFEFKAKIIMRIAYSARNC